MPFYYNYIMEGVPLNCMYKSSWGWTLGCSKHVELEFYGVKGKAKLRFESYFSSRYQRVSITNSVLNWNYFSTWEEIEHGVLQGSILVSLFLFYINDLPKAINDKSIPILLAYDTSILNAELNPICHLLALLGAHHILHISRIRVNHKSKQKWLST